MRIEDLIPKALLQALEQEGKSLVNTPEGWITVDTSAIQLSTTLPLVNQKLDIIISLLQDSREVKDNERQEERNEGGA